MEHRRPFAVIACASFKGTLSSRLAGHAIARGLERAGIDSVVIALADGGEGLVEALVSQVPAACYVDTMARGPLLDEVAARFGIMGPTENATAVIEMAASSGLSLVSKDKRDPKITTTLGVGDQMRAALDLPNKRIAQLLIGLGGSATNDGGAGMARALGARLLDADDNELAPGGLALARLARIDMTGFDDRMTRIPITAACDVSNPLCGPDGASVVYGPQKGATPDDVEWLDAALAHYAFIVQRDLGKSICDVPGGGAAGGLGAGLLAFCNAKLVSGIDLLLDMIGFDDLLEQASLVVTGEGHLDGQTLMGKTPLGIARRAARRGISCIAVAGDVDGACMAELLAHFSRIESLGAFAGSIEHAKANAAQELEELSFVRARQWMEVATAR